MKSSRIRSFVCRTGRVTARQQRALSEAWGQYVIDLGGGLQFADVFQEHPITLEIGFGMGASLAQMAASECNMHFLGVEVHRPGIGSLLADITERQLSNIHIICADVVEVVQQFIPHASLDRILIFFPDPWQKQRHHKRRLVQVEFIQQLQLRLKPGGILHMATDFANYAEHMQHVMAQVDGFVRLADDASPRPETKFERRGIRLGNKIFDLVYKNQ